MVVLCSSAAQEPSVYASMNQNQHYRTCINKSSVLQKSANAQMWIRGFKHVPEF